MTEPVVRAVHVRGSAQHAFQVFTDGIAGWWPLPSHSVHEDDARDVRFVDGRLVEFAAGGEQCVWGEVLAWDPPHRLALTFHPGRESGTAVEVEFTPDEDGTRVVLTHHGWEDLGPRADAIRESYGADTGWTLVLGRYAEAAGGDLVSTAN